jgi:hypothetical protein
MDQPVPFHPERRRFPRLKTGVQIELRRKGSEVPIRVGTSDIGVAGCYVEMSITLEVRSEVDVVIWLNGEALRTRARVITCHPQFGNGFEFIDLSSDDQERLSAFVNSQSE